MFFNRDKYPFETKIRHHVSAHNYLPKSELKNIPENYPPLIDNIDWDKKFVSGAAPKMLDIGCGKGLFLLQYSFENPHINCLGIEIREYPVEWINNVVKGEELKNCSAIRYSVANGLPFIDDGSINNIFYLFPDPWVKNKHSKRRAFNLNFLNEIYNKLTPDGSLWLATDVKEVYDYQSIALDKFNKFKVIDVGRNSGWDFPYTNKENFCKMHNIEIFRSKCSK